MTATTIYSLSVLSFTRWLAAGTDISKYIQGSKPCPGFADKSPFLAMLMEVEGSSWIMSGSLTALAMVGSQILALCVFRNTG